MHHDRVLSTHEAQHLAQLRSVDVLTAVYGNAWSVISLVVIVPAPRAGVPPIKALLLNVFSIGAGYDVTVLVWQPAPIPDDSAIRRCMRSTAGMDSNGIATSSTGSECSAIAGRWHLLVLATGHWPRNETSHRAEDRSEAYAPPARCRPTW